MLTLTESRSECTEFLASDMSHMRQVSAALRSILISQLISSMKAAELPENNPIRRGLVLVHAATPMICPDAPWLW
jgi:protein gp37